MHCLGPHIIQVSMAHTRWARWCVGGFSPVETCLVSTVLPARLCCQPHDSLGGCIKWISSSCHACPKRFPQLLHTQDVPCTTWNSLAQVCLRDLTDHESGVPIVSDSQQWMSHGTFYSGMSSLLMHWLYNTCTASYRLMLSLVGPDTLIQVSAYCCTGYGPASDCIHIWSVSTVLLYQIRIPEYSRDQRIGCEMPTPRTGRSPLPRRRQQQVGEREAVDPLRRAPLQRTRLSGGPNDVASTPAATTAWTPLPRLRPRAAQHGKEQPAAKKARPQPKLHPRTSMVSLDNVVIIPRRSRSGGRAGRTTAKATGVDDGEDSSSDDIRVCATPVSDTTGRHAAGRTRIRFKPRPAPPKTASRMQGDDPVRSGGGLTATGAKAKQKARQRKIRGSLRECLRIATKTRAKTKAGTAKGHRGSHRHARSSTASAHIPPASMQAPTHTRLDMEAVAVLEPTDWTVVTEERLPGDAEDTLEMTDDKETTADSAAVRKRSTETKEALLRWQREQFAQRAELVRMQASARDASHPSAESFDTSAYMGLPASLFVSECIPQLLCSVLPVLPYVAAAFWTAHGASFTCWAVDVEVYLQAMLAFRSRMWSWRLLHWPLPYSACKQSFTATSDYQKVPYRMHLCTYLLRRRIMLIIRMCIGLLSFWWRALFGACLCGLVCKRWLIAMSARYGQPPHPYHSTPQQVPIQNNHKYPHATLSCPGLNPRGDRTSPSRFLRRLLFMLILQSRILPVTGVRVGSEPTALPGAQNGRLDSEVTTRAKPSGNPSFSGPYLGAVRKRAFKRACDRAAIRGGTYYRGTWHTARALQAMRVQPGIQHRETPRQEHARGRGTPRVHVLSWNAGGLSLAMFDELILLLNTVEYQHVSAAIIQETHWKHESTWRASGWNCVHSGCETESHPGILIMIRDKMVPHELVRYDVIQPGRILHVRAPFGSARLDRSLDLIGIYQYPWDTRKPRQQLLDAREGVWKKLDTVLRRLPQRNLLFVCGDCNVQLPSQDKHVGTGIVLRPSNTQQASDPGSLLKILISHDLCALNTWRGPSKQAYTYSMGPVRTLIDYVFVRTKDADSIAKGCLPVTTFPIADWRLDGRHRVLIASLAVSWKVRTGQKPKPAYDREAMLADYKRDPLLTEVSHAFQSLMMQENCKGAEEISSCLLQACCQVYPVAMAPPPADRMQLVRGPIATMWATWREMRAVRGATLRSIILTWKLRVRFKAQKRIVDRASKEQRKLRVHTLLDQAETDDRNHNARGLYSIVRKLAPKQRYKPLQVKTDKGVCLSSREEVAELKKFFGGVFCDAATVVVGPCDVPFSPQLEAVTRALKQLPAHKAVPHTCAPSIAWKACADTLAQYLHSAFEDMCLGPVPKVSNQWKDGWMVLAPKAGKPLCRACDVRPLALQDPGGKAAIRTVKEAIQPFVDECMKTIPQYAYLQNRDGQMAILRACAHLRQVRQMVAGQTYTVHHHKDGHRRMTLCGGLTLSLDLRMAFDVLPRLLVERSLREAHIPTGLISLIMAWLTDSSYHLSHAGEAFTLTPTRGIRQGCVLSPLIWTCVTGTMVRDLAALDIAVTDLDLYADDYLHQELLTTYEAFAPALTKLGVIIQYLQEQGLQVSLDKTVVLCRLAGTRASMAMKQHTFKRKDREGIERIYVKIPTKYTMLHLPLVQEHKYMGIMASYHNFEDKTLHHRLASARNTYTRLKPFLRSRKRLSLPGRLRMWWTCVWSSMRYALPSVGVTGAGATNLRGLVATHMRALAVSPRHLTGETTESLFARLGVRDPVCMLEVLAGQQMKRLEQCVAQGLGKDVMTDDMINQAAWAHELWQQHAASDNRSHMRLQRLEHAEEGWPCPHCGIYFISELAVTTHIGHQHAELHQKVKDAVGEMRPEDMGVNGMPTCRFCQKKHHSWQTLKRHIQQGRCQVLHARVVAGASILDEETKSTAPAQPPPLVQQHELLQRLADHQLDSSKIADEVRAQIIQNCCICGQWIADSRQVKQHIRQSHTDIWNKHHADIDTLCATFGRSITVPCGFCGTDKINSSNRPRHAKLCGVLFQTLLAIRIAQQVKAMSEQEMGFFRHLLPNGGGENARGTGTGDSSTRPPTMADRLNTRPVKWPKSAGKGRGQGGQPRRPKRSTPSSDQSMEEQEEGLMELLKATARLAIRLEDQQSLDRLDKAFLLHQRTQVPECMLEEMFKISETWKEAKASVPPKVETSLRVILFKSYMLEFQSRLRKIEHAEVVQGLVEQGWLFKQGEDLTWRYLAWDTTAQKDIQHPTLEPQTHATILQAVQTLLELVSDQTLHRYHATRPLAATFTGPSVCFMLEVSLRGAHAQKMYQALSTLAQCAALKLMGANLVRERINRSPLATKIHKMLDQ